MATVKKARLFLRRGTDAQRGNTTFCEGELGYSTDAFRVYIGDGETKGGLSLGTKVFVLSANNTHTKLNGSTYNGTVVSAMSGDIAISTPASYTNEKSVTVNPLPGSSAVLLLTGADPSNNDSWVGLNSAIPYNQLVIGDNDISADKIHDGTISGTVNISAGDLHIGGQTSDQLFLSGVGLNAQDKPQGTVIYPLGITNTSEVTCISSIFGFGEQSASLGNALGHIKAIPNSASTSISAFKSQGADVTKSTLGTVTLFSGNQNSYVNVFTNYISSYSQASNSYLTYGFPHDFDSDGENINVSEVVYTLADIRTAVNQASLVWNQIENFYFSWYGMLGESRCGFFGYYNALMDANVPLEMLTTNAQKKKINKGPSLHMITIPNTYDTTEELRVHIGNQPSGYGGYFLIGIKVKT